MNQTLEHDQIDTRNQGAATEGKRGRAARGAASTLVSQHSDDMAAASVGTNGLGGTDTGHEASGVSESANVAESIAILGAHAQAKFVLFAIGPEERVDSGPVMRGFIELPAVDGAEAPKINVAGWAKVGRESGAEYLSLKVGNTRQPSEPLEGAAQWDVGPFYGRLFKETNRARHGERIRYFGFIEHSERVGEDQSLRGIYKTHWQVTIRAKRATSSDGRTTYITGTVAPGHGKESGSGDLPF